MGVVTLSYSAPRWSVQRACRGALRARCFLLSVVRPRPRGEDADADTRTDALVDENDSAINSTNPTFDPANLVFTRGRPVGWLVVNFEFKFCPTQIQLGIVDLAPVLPTGWPARGGWS